METPVCRRGRRTHGVLLLSDFWLAIRDVQQACENDHDEL
jgi:hypothetical protein